MARHLELLGNVKAQLATKDSLDFFNKVNWKS